MSLSATDGAFRTKHLEPCHAVLVLTFRVACVLGFAALIVGCSPNASDDTSTSESAVIVCGPDGGQTLAQGIDVSHYSGDIDWTTVQGTGVDFAFAKATEGTDFTDPQFAANWAGMQDAGVVRGAYHYFHPELDPDMQAAFVVQTVGTLSPNDFPIVLDLEINGGESEDVVVANALTFLTDVETATGRTPIIYTSNRVITTVSGSSPNFAHYPLWDAEYGVDCPNIPSPWTMWNLWQTDGTASVDGVPPGLTVDLDTFNGTIDDLHAFVSGVSDAGTITNDDGGTPRDGGSTSVGVDGGGAIEDASLAESPDGASGSGGCACSLDRGSRSSSFSWLWLGALACVLCRRTVASAFHPRKPQE